MMWTGCPNTCGQARARGHHARFVLLRPSPVLPWRRLAAVESETASKPLTHSSRRRFA